MPEKNELYYVIRFCCILTLALVLFSLFGCAGSMETRLPAHPKEQIVVFDTHEEFCAKYHELTPSGRKCRPKQFGFTRGYTIYLKTDFTTCHLNHERGHVWGWPHDNENWLGRNGSCGPWEIDPSWSRSARNYVEAGG